MNSIEEQLWNYIDGNYSPDEQEAIRRLIEQDQQYRDKYRELLSFNQEMQAVTPDEPPMAFTYKVMESIRLEAAQKPLKATIDQRIIKGISVFFGIVILAMLVYAFANIQWSAGNVTGQLGAIIKVPQLQSFFNGPVMKGFLIFDVVAALFFFDALLHKKDASRRVKL